MVAAYARDRPRARLHRGPRHRRRPERIASPRGRRRPRGWRCGSRRSRELTAAELLGLFRDCADRAEQLRRGGQRGAGDGCELTLFNPGFLPGPDSYDRIARLGKPGPRLFAAFARLPKRLNAFLAEAADTVRSRFGGPLTYASGTWEPVDWSRFDIVSVDAYRDAETPARSAPTCASNRPRQAGGRDRVRLLRLRRGRRQGRHGLGYRRVRRGRRPQIKGRYQRDKSEQVTYLQS